MVVSLVIATPFGYLQRKKVIGICAARAMTYLPSIPYTLSAWLRPKKS